MWHARKNAEREGSRSHGSGPTSLTGAELFRFIPVVSFPKEWVGRAKMLVPAPPVKRGRQRSIFRVYRVHTSVPTGTAHKIVILQLKLLIHERDSNRWWWLTFFFFVLQYPSIKRVCVKATNYRIRYRSRGGSFYFHTRRCRFVLRTFNRYVFVSL